jgi:hypothetical protein
MPTYNNTGSVTHAIGSKPTRLLQPGDTGFETPLVLGHLDGVVRTADTPTFNLLRGRHDLSFSGVGQQTVPFSNQHLIKSILISSSMPVDMFLNAADNVPAKRLLANREYFLVPNGMIESLIFDAKEAGVVVVEVIGPSSADEEINAGVTFGGEGVTFGGQGVTW